MNNPSEPNPDLAKRADLDRDHLQDGASVEDQPESGTSRREEDIRQSAPANSRMDQLNTEIQAPEEA